MRLAERDGQLAEILVEGNEDARFALRRIVMRLRSSASFTTEVRFSVQRFYATSDNATNANWR